MAAEKSKKQDVKPKGITNEIKQNIDLHKRAAQHHETAAKHHLDAVTFHEAGTHEKAHQSSIIANGHSLEARTLEKEDVKQHAAIK